MDINHEEMGYHVKTNVDQESKLTRNSPVGVSSILALT